MVESQNPPQKMPNNNSGVGTRVVSCSLNRVFQVIELSLFFYTFLVEEVFLDEQNECKETGRLAD